MTKNDLPEAELDVMSCLWATDGSTAREIRDALSDRRPMAHATVCTLLRRLEEKGCVSRKKAGVGKAYLYQAEIQPSEPARNLLDKILDRVFGGSGVALVASLLESRPPEDDEIDQMRRMLDELKKRPAKTRPKRRRS